MTGSSSSPTDGDGEWNDPPMLEEENWFQGNYVPQNVFSPLEGWWLAGFAFLLSGAVVLLVAIPPSVETPVDRFRVAWGGWALGYVIQWALVRGRPSKWLPSILGDRFDWSEVELYPTVRGLRGMAIGLYLGFVVVLLMSPGSGPATRFNVAMAGVVTCYVMVRLMIRWQQPDDYQNAFGSET